MSIARVFAVAAVILGAPATGAQSPVAGARPPLKKGIPAVAARPACASVAPPRPPTADQRRQARELAQRGQQAAILGDRVAARDQLRSAAALDPSDPDLAYQLARADESTGASAEAANEYCRFLALAPDAPDAAEARARIAELLVPSGEGAADIASAAFARGVSAYDLGHLESADSAFSVVIAREPGWAIAYYDRALTRAALGRRDGELSDYQSYLLRAPSASDRSVVESRVAALDGSAPSPARALSLGLVIPGAGQFYAGRPVRGLLTLVGTGAALACAMRQTANTRTFQESALDPFGNPYNYTVSRQVSERPCLTPGIAAAGAIALVSAIDAFTYVRRVGEGTRVTVALAPDAQRVSFRVTLR
jgi:tetratricopeptide (TPR) repeat protein